MFKNLMVYRLAADWTASVAQIEAALDAARFTECGLTQARAVGWVSPRGEEHGVLIEAIAGQWLLQLMVESKVVHHQILEHAHLIGRPDAARKKTRLCLLGRGRLRPWPPR